MSHIHAPTPAIRLEGGLLSPDILEAALAGDLPGQQPRDFGLDGSRSLTDEIASAFADAQAQWALFRRRLARTPPNPPAGGGDWGGAATAITRDAWVIPFLSLLGYDLHANPHPYEIDEARFAISHRAGAADDAPPVHIVGVRQDLGRAPPGSLRVRGGGRIAPHVLVQEYLNRSEQVWGLVTNGRTLRLLRNSTYLRRQAYVECDLAQILDEQRFADFAALYRLIHRTRLPHTAADARDCWLERYHQHALEQGGRVRDRLRDGVEQGLLILANGFLAHPANMALRAALRLPPPGEPVPDDVAAALYRQALRIVYRVLFLLTAEDRGLISDDPHYAHYGVGRLRRLLTRRSAFTDHVDLWLGFQTLRQIVSDAALAALLGAAPLNGDLFAPVDLDAAVITNRDLLRAVRHLAWYGDPPRRINYAALDTEELGSVYESLLELHPTITWRGAVPVVAFAARSAERRATGSHYTPPELVAPLVQHALEPALRARLAPCRTPAEREAALLGLTVLDPACGSGHFLLAAARHLGTELARIRSGDAAPAPEIVRDAMRDVIAHCLYGVDRNPLAVELCRVALWLEGHARGRPLTFLDHRIRCGDSLLGVADLQALEAGIPDDAYRPLGTDDRAHARQVKARNAREARMDLFRHGFVTAPLADLAAQMHQVAAMPDRTVEQVHAKSAAYRRVITQDAYRRLRLACDVWTAAFFQSFAPPHAGAANNYSPFPGGVALTTAAVQEALTHGALRDPRQGAFVLEMSQTRAFFHWALEFPDAAAAGGFAVILGNPPFMGGLRISGVAGEAYRRWLEAAYAPFGGTADLCSAFFRRAFALLRPGGRLGMIATNSIGQGDTRESGLKVILAQGGRIAFARRFVRWPGQANVEVNLVVIEAPRATLPNPPALPPSPPVGGGTPPNPPAGGGDWGGGALLDDRPVAAISSRLDAEPDGEPARLRQNDGKAFIGDFVRGLGFVLEAAEAEALLARDPRNADGLFPYLNGDDLNTHPAQQPGRWVICFHDWDLARAQQYPDLLRIVEERVKPERERLRGPGDARNRAAWWQFGAYRAGMRHAIDPLRRVLVRAEVSQMHMVAFVPKGWVYSHMLVVFAFDDDYHFALLQSGVHEAWVWRQASSLESRNRYTPTDCFATFPFPPAEYAAPSPQSPPPAGGFGGVSPHAGGTAGVLALPAFAHAAQIGAAYHERRREIMQARRIGLTKTYNLVHDPACRDADIVDLRQMHAALDAAILACYGWDDLDPGHDFHANARGQTRFGMAPDVQRAVVQRLLDLNLAVATGRV
jgi:hypothetical protein